MRIAQLASARVPGDRVDGEVAAAQVLLDGVGEHHPRMAAVRLHVPPEGGDLVQVPAVPQHPHRAVREPHGHGAAEDAPDVAGARGSRQVPVERATAGERVAHGAPHRPGLEAGLLQAPDDPDDLRGRLQQGGTRRGIAHGAPARRGRGAVQAHLLQRLGEMDTKGYLPGPNLQPASA